MPDLNFSVEGAAPIPFAAAPTLAFKLRITNADPAEHIQNILLSCQIQIESTRRRYTPEEKGRLLDLFGEPRSLDADAPCDALDPRERHGAAV